MVLAEGLGHECREATWQQESEGGIGSSSRGRHASNVGGWFRVSLDENRAPYVDGGLAKGPRKYLEVNSEFRVAAEGVLRGRR